MDNHAEDRSPESTVASDLSTAESASDASASLPSVVQTPAPLILQPVQPPLHPAVTVICTLLFLTVIGAKTVIVWTTDRENQLEAPEEFLEHVFGRNLDLEEFADRRSDAEKLLDRLQGYEPGDMLDDAITAYSDYLSTSKSDWTRLERTLVILCGEAHRLDEAEDTLVSLEQDPVEEVFVEAARSAYRNGAASLPEQIPSLDQVSAMVHPAWARDKFIARLAERRGEHTAAAAARQRVERRAQKLHGQIMPLIWCPVVICAGGILAIFVWVALRFPKYQVGTGVTSSPWTAGRGAAVLVRAALGGLIVTELTGSVIALLPALAWLRGFASLLAILPLLWIGTRQLLRPWGHTLTCCFGLSVPPKRWIAMLLFTLVLAAVDQVGSTAISAVLDHYGIRMHWSESPQEDYLWMPWWQVSLDFWDGVVWAPIFEEIGCRGFLYITVRRHFRPAPAALITGLIFGAAHFYSLSGFLSVAWSGFLWSLAYDKSRSLVPGMISHSLGNIMAFGGMVLLYRI
jgi:membrane protease YdiL (CAAX protease family)